MTGIRTVRAGEAGFIGQKHSGLNGVVDSLNQFFQPFVVVGQADRVEMPDSRSFGLGDDIEAERRPFPGELLEGVAEHGRLQVAVGFAVRPHARSRLEVDQTRRDRLLAERQILGDNHVDFTDERQVRAGDVNLERHGHSLDVPVIAPFPGDGFKHA